MQKWLLKRTLPSRMKFLKSIITLIQNSSESEIPSQEANYFIASFQNLVGNTIESLKNQTSSEEQDMWQSFHGMVQKNPDTFKTICGFLTNVLALNDQMSVISQTYKAH